MGAVSAGVAIAASARRAALGPGSRSRAQDDEPGGSGALARPGHASGAESDAAAMAAARAHPDWIES